MPIFGLQPPGLMQTILEDIGVAVVVVNHEEKIVFANHTALRTFGATKTVNGARFGDLRGKFRFEDLSGREIPLADSAIARALRGEHVQGLETRVIKSNGESRWLITWTYEFSVMGMEGVVALIIDQTTEVELRRVALQMQRMETQGAIAAALTHDFNNVLNTISTNVALTTEANDCPESLRPRLEQISDAVDKASGLIKRLMQFSRAQELHLQSLGVNGVVNDVLRLIEPLLTPKVRLSVDLAPRLPSVRGDASQIEQVLVNLIVNALDAMPEGGRLTISTGLAQVHAKGTNNQQEVVQILVADTGIGIPLEIQSAIFEPFFTTKAGGTGLGLSSSFGIVRQHEGTLEVNSSLGKGTVFTVSFPVEIASPAAAA